MNRPQTSAPAISGVTPNPPSLGRDKTTWSALDLSTPMAQASAGSTDTLDGHKTSEAHGRSAVEGQTSPQARPRFGSSAPTPAGAKVTAAAMFIVAPSTRPPLPCNTSQAAHEVIDAHIADGGLAPTLPGGQGDDEALAIAAAGGSTQPTATHHAVPRKSSLSAGTSPRTANRDSAPREVAPSGDRLPREAMVGASPMVGSPLAEQTPPLAKRSSATIPAAPGVDKQGPQDPAKVEAITKGASLELADSLLALAADVLDDLERVWIANANRLRQLTRNVEDKDGEERGFGLTLDHPDVARLAALVDALDQAQQQATKNLTKRLKAHPLAPWLKAQKGVGDKQAARLLAAIGDPYWNDLHDRPRTVSELWAYCGYHVLPAGQVMDDPQRRPASAGKTGHPDQTKLGSPSSCVGVAPKRARGAKANWSANAKMRTYLVAESCMKVLRRPCAKDDDLGYAVHVDGCECSPFRVVYDAARAKHADAVHGVECVRCGPKGKPAAVGSPLSDAHKMARALRAVSKELLKGLWREARRLHGIDDST